MGSIEIDWDLSAQNGNALLACTDRKLHCRSTYRRLLARPRTQHSHAALTARALHAGTLCHNTHTHFTCTARRHTIRHHARTERSLHMHFTQATVEVLHWEVGKVVNLDFGAGNMATVMTEGINSNQAIKTQSQLQLQLAVTVGIPPRLRNIPSASRAIYGQDGRNTWALLRRYNRVELYSQCLRPGTCY